MLKKLLSQLFDKLEDEIRLKNHYLTAKILPICFF